MTQDTLGDRMKDLERVEAGRKLQYPVCMRLDGRSFSSFTRGLPRPYDARLSKLMVDLTKALVEETGASIGYTQSDEISLVLAEPPSKGEGYFGLKAQKLCSVTASFAGAFFARELCRVPAPIPERGGETPLFDSRAWSVPTLEDAAAVLLWRELDARKNATTMAASVYYSHAMLLKKNSDEKIKMLAEKGVIFDEYPTFFRRGTYVRRFETTKPFTTEELEALPPKHHARLNPGLVVTRHVIEEFDIKTPLARLANRVDVLFNGAEEIIYTKPVTSMSGGVVPRCGAIGGGEHQYKTHCALPKGHAGPCDP